MLSYVAMLPRLPISAITSITSYTSASPDPHGSKAMLLLLATLLYMEC